MRFGFFCIFTVCGVFKWFRLFAKITEIDSMSLTSFIRKENVLTIIVHSLDGCIVHMLYLNVKSVRLAMGLVMNKYDKCMWVSELIGSSLNASTMKTNNKNPQANHNIYLFGLCCVLYKLNWKKNETKDTNI